MFKPDIGRIGTAPRVSPATRVLNRQHPLFSKLVWCSAPSSAFRQELLTGANGFYVEFSGTPGRFNIPTRMGMGCGSTVDGGGVAWPWSPHFLRIKRDFTFVMWMEVFEAGSGYLWNVNWDGSTFWKSMGQYYEKGNDSFKVRFIDSGGNLRQAAGPDNFYVGGTDGLRCVAFRRNGSNCEYFRDGVYFGSSSHGSSADVDWGTYEDVTVATRTTYSPGDGLQCVVPLVYLFEGQIPNGAIVELYNNPFALFGEDISPSLLMFDIPAVAYSWNLTMP